MIIDSAYFIHSKRVTGDLPPDREGRGAMVRAWRSVDVAVFRAVSNPAWCRIFR